MPNKITVGPPVITINRGTTFVVSDHSGEIHEHEAQGVFADDTRFVSGYRLWVDGHRWQHVSSANTSHHTCRFYLTYAFGHAEETGVTTEGSLGLAIVRAVDDGVHEVLEITNYAAQDVAIVFELELISDFSDLFEVKTGRLRQRANLVTQWDVARAQLTTTYQHQDFLRRFTYQVVGASQPPTYANGRLLFPVSLRPRQVWRACGHMHLQSGQRVKRPSHAHRATDGENDRATRLHQRWLKSCTELRCPNADLEQAYLQSLEDMGALRLYEEDLGPDVWVPAAGVPWFVTLFGRDSLVASIQAISVNPRFAEGTLRTLARYQARERDDLRDAQPGKIMHEIRYGELAHFNRVPQTPYYGTWDATPLYVLLLHQAWRWLGDRQLVEDLWPTAERCLEWIDTYGDVDGDGFQEYQTYSRLGYPNMGWKDAHDAVVYPDGSQVARQPKALCELQGYAYAARLSAAELAGQRGDHERARGLRGQAAALKRRFNEAFWMEDEGTYAFGLDADKRQIRTITSNPGHCLWSGIVDDDKAERVVRRLLAPDMWSGWGIRTLSAANPAYNPYSYQRGSVWPHDNGIIAAGMKRYGFHAEANQVAQGILAAAGRFHGYRLPEVFAGLGRDEAPFPVQYLGANTPQVWAAGSVFHFVQAMLGLEADAAGGRLRVHPTLPEWAPRLELAGVRVGLARLRLRFWREGGASRCAVQSCSGGHVDVEDEQWEMGNGRTDEPLPVAQGGQGEGAASRSSGR